MKKWCQYLQPFRRKLSLKKIIQRPLVAKPKVCGAPCHACRVGSSSTTMSESFVILRRLIRTLFDFVEISKCPPYGNARTRSLAIYTRPIVKNTNDRVKKKLLHTAYTLLTSALGYLSAAALSLATQSILYKMLSYRRETALQGTLVLAESGRLELRDNILLIL